MDTADSPDRQPNEKIKRKPLRKILSGKINFRWAIRITIITFAISLTLSTLSTNALSGLGMLPSFLLLVFFILVGILFDIIGIAVTSAEEAAFHSMAARRVRGAKESVWLIHNADKVSNFCNDVVGDIVGIISGTVGATIAVSLSKSITLSGAITQVALTALIAGITVGGKAMGKGVAISLSHRIVFISGKFLSFFPRFQGKK